MTLRENKEKKELSPREKALRAKEFLHTYARYSGIAFQMIVLIGGGAYLGYYLDGRYETSPVWTVVGSLLGVALSLYTLYKSLLELERFNRRMDAERKELEKNNNK